MTAAIRQRSSFARVFATAISLALLAPAVVLAAQQPASPDPASPDSSPASNAPLVAVLGVVRNAATGEPLARALVTLNGSHFRGALTDGEGRFEIAGVPSEVQNFAVIKPGFQDLLENRGRGLPHIVRVSSGMPELAFTLVPQNAIYGHVTLSSGAPAQGVGIVLMRQTISDGRVAWDQVDSHRCTPDGNFRFGGLPEGTYLLATQPEFDNIRAIEPRCNANTQQDMPGYAAVFYGDAQDLAGAARIVLAKGQSAEANLSLNLTTFHLVESAPIRLPNGANWKLTHSLLDHSGQQADYPVHEEKDHSLCVYLPDGSYTMEEQVVNQKEELPGTNASSGSESNREMAGFTPFSVEGHAILNLHVPLAPTASTSVRMRYEPSPPKPEKPGKSNDEEPMRESDVLSLSAVSVNPAATGRDLTVESEPISETSYQLPPAVPGAYWIGASSGRQGVCVGSVTAGGQSLANTPWTVGASGAGPPIDVVMRTDCAKLTVQMPASLAAANAGEGATLHVYAVPAFDSMEGVAETQVEQFDARSAALEDLPPGEYRVFAFTSPQSIEFRTPAAIDRLGAGQQITLAPGADATLVLEGISQ